MDEQFFVTIMNEYYSFKDRLEKRIKKSAFSCKYEDYYLIDENWNNKLVKCFTDYKALKKSNENLKISKDDCTLPEGDPEFINDFPKLIRHLKNNKNIKLVSKRLIEFIYSKNDLKGVNYVYYFAGNNKLIIEYKGMNEKHALLSMAPLDEKINKNKLFILVINKQEKLFLYKNLLSNENDLDIEKSTNFDSIIIPFDEYISCKHRKNNSYVIKQIEFNQGDFLDTFKKELLKIFIYIFYYEKSLSSESKENAFNILSDNQNYFFISHQWLNEYKEYYNYKNLNDSLKLFDQKNSKINYNNLEKYISNIIEIYINNKDILNFDNRELPKDLKNQEKMKPPIFKENNIVFKKNFFILSPRILNSIKKMSFPNVDLKLQQKEIIIKDKDIFICEFKSIIIGNLSNDLTFIPKIIFSYNLFEIIKFEKKLLLSNSINDYIKLRNCESNLRKIKTDNKEEIIIYIIKNPQLENRINRNSNEINLGEKVFDTDPNNIRKVGSKKIIKKVIKKIHSQSQLNKVFKKDETSNSANKTKTLIITNTNIIQNQNSENKLKTGGIVKKVRKLKRNNTNTNNLIQKSERRLKNILLNKAESKTKKVKKISKNKNELNTSLVEDKTFIKTSLKKMEAPLIQNVENVNTSVELQQKDNIFDKEFEMNNKLNTLKINKKKIKSKIVKKIQMNKKDKDKYKAIDKEKEKEKDKEREKEKEKEKEKDSELDKEKGITKLKQIIRDKEEKEDKLNRTLSDKDQNEKGKEENNYNNNIPQDSINVTSNFHKDSISSNNNFHKDSINFSNNMHKNSVGKKGRYKFIRNRNIFSDKDEKENLENQINELIIKNNEKEKEINNLKDSLNKEIEKNKEFQDLIYDLRSENNELKEKNLNIQRQLDESINSKNERNNNEVLRRIREYENEMNKNFQNLMGQMKTENMKLQQNYENAQKELQKKEKQIKEDLKLNDEHKYEKEELKKAKVKLQQNKKEINDLKDYNSKCQKEIKELKKSNYRIQQELKNKENILEKYQTKILMLKTRIKEKDDEISKMSSVQISQEDKNLFMVNDDYNYDYEANNPNEDVDSDEKLIDYKNNTYTDFYRRNKDFRNRENIYYMDDEEELNEKMAENTERNKVILMEDKKYFQVNEITDSQKVKEHIKRSIGDPNEYEPKRSDTLKGTKITDNVYKKQRLSDIQSKRKYFTNAPHEQNDRFSRTSRGDNF